jgi:hypothetical protein
MISLSGHLPGSIFSREGDIASTQNLLISFKPIICKLNYSHVIIIIIIYVVERVMEGKNESKPGMSKKLSIRASLMTPVLPMLVGLFSFLTIYTVIMWNRNIYRKCQCFP